MTSRLWNNPPVDATGALDYAQLTLAELHEDLCETLSDLVHNAGKRHVKPYLDRLEADAVWTASRARSDLAPADFVTGMLELRVIIAADECLASEAAGRTLDALAAKFEAITVRAS